MATVDRDILTIVEPTIKVDEVFIEAEEGKEALEERDVSNNQQTTQQKETEGALYPMIQIGSIKVAQDDCESMELSLDSFLPEVIVEIADNANKLSDISYPLDGDVLSLYLKPRPMEEYRPIRIDFDIMGITSIPANPGGGEEGEEEEKSPAIFTFRGVMRVPLLHADVLQGFAEGNSFDHLLECAEGLGLGFASNVDGTDDLMARICAQQTREEFIQQTTLTAYRDDESFFTTYVDFQYYLCMVNVNQQFSIEDEMETVTVEPQLDMNLQVGSTAENETEGSLRLSNSQEVAGSDMAIASYNLINNSGAIWYQNGYARKLSYLNLNENNNGGENDGVEEFLITPLNTPGTEGELIPLRGRMDDEGWDKNNKCKYIGKQSSEEFTNMHSNYMYAIGQNFANNDEIQKMIMEVELETVNWSLYRYQRIPVLIYTEGSVNNKNLENRDSQLGDDKQPKGNDEVEGEEPPNYDDPNQQVKNEFLSGWYVISEMKYKYNKDTGKIQQSLKLLRREWPIPGKLKDN